METSDTSPIPQNSPENSSDANGQIPQAADLPKGILRKKPWLTFLLPMLVFMLSQSLEPVPPGSSASNSIGKLGSLGIFITYEHYPIIYSIRIALTAAAMIFVWPGYRTFKFRISPLAIVVGVLGVVAWVGICHLQLERRALEPLGLAKYLGLVGERSAFNPLKQMADRPALAYAFLAVRFMGLALIVPVIEEFFLRGFLMRYVMDGAWWKVPFGYASRLAIVLGTAVPMLMHPGELIAALVWFSAVTWLMLRTRNIWDCVAAHAVTNFLLGVYVVWSGHWELM